MGENRRLNAADRRSQLLETALKLFSQKGFGGTTTKEIAAAAGVAEQIVFRHFPSKQALYQAVLESSSDCPTFRKWMDDARACMDRNDDEGLMRAIAAAVIENFRSDPRMERLMLFAALEGQETALDHHRNVSLPIYELLREYIERRQQQGGLAGIHPAAVLSAITGMAYRYATFAQLFRMQVELTDEQAVESFTRILMDGIRPKGAK